MHANARELVIVESRAFELAVVHPEAERLDQVQQGGRVGGEPDDVAGVGRNFRVHEDDGEFRRVLCGGHRRLLGSSHGGSVRATTQHSTRSAPAATSVRAASASVAPVVIDVVDERDARSAHIRLRRERAADVAPALGPRAAWPAADRRQTRTSGVGERQAGAAGDVDANLARLVEAALALPLRCERQRLRCDSGRSLPVRPASETRTAAASAAPAHSASAIRPPYLMRWSKRSVGKA